ncbi:MAG: hypothetical protein AABO58_19780 [Acidobacteriota bacterium]
MNEQRTIPNVNRKSIVGVLFIWLFAGFWNGFIVVMLLVARGGPLMLAIASPFILAGIYLLSLAIRATLTVIRYRSLVLRLDTMPGVVGGRMAGTVQGAEGALREGMSVRLACWRRYRSDTTDDMLWEDVLDVAPGSVVRSPAGATVPFRFDIPFECEPSESDDGRIAWQITVQTHGGGFAGAFDVPVYRTAQSSPEVTEKSLRPRTVSQPQYSKVHLERAADGAVEVRFPKPTWVWKWYLFTLVVTLSGLVAVRQKVPDQLWDTAIYLGIAAVALVLIAIIQMGLFFAPRLLRVGRDELRMRFLSMFRGATVMPSANIADFVIKYANGKYDVDLQRADGKVYPWLFITAVDKREADWLAHELRGALRK